MVPGIESVVRKEANMRGVAYALLASGLLAFGALFSGSASADCYRDCGYHLHRHHHAVRIAPRPIHHVHHFVHHYAPAAYGLPDELDVLAEDGLTPVYPDSVYVGGYYDQPYYRPFPYHRPRYDAPNGYYVSGTSGYGGGYRGLVSGGYAPLSGWYGGGYGGFYGP
jgi:hypothetical protein